MHQLDGFRQVWVFDFEFNSKPGERPKPVCMVARELRTAQVVRVWFDQFNLLTRPPFHIGPDVLFVGYFTSADLGCFLSLGWPLPTRILDLYTEYRSLTNGRPEVVGYKLINALTYFGVDSIGAVEKREMQGLAVRGGPYTREEETALLGYCESDVNATARLLKAMLPFIDWSPRATLRGRYMGAVARMEFTGVPVNTGLLGELRENWVPIKNQLIGKINANYAVFDGTTFKTDRFERWLVQNRIVWPVLKSGRIDLKDDTFRQMARIHPQVSALRELRHTLSRMRLEELAVGPDGCNRCLLSPFRAKTSRNQPSNTRFIFGPSVWLRFLIKPPPGWAVAYIDWEQQEFGIGAYLSGDPVMMAAYETGDAYLAFAKRAGAVPDRATKKTHKAIRDQYKICALGTQYGIGPESLAARINQHALTARHLLQQHKNLYQQYWRWSDNTVGHASFFNFQATVFGWTYNIPPDFNPRSVRNFHMQANGSEMLRIACCEATENGILLCAPVHDAVMVMAPVGQIESDVARTRAYMEQASRYVLGGFPLRTEKSIVTYPDHYTDDRGSEMWSEVMGSLNQLKGAACEGG
jgi:DNA polymerase I